MTSLVFPHIGNVLHFLKTNVALKYLLRLSRMFAVFQVNTNVTYSFITYRTKMHVFEVNSHVSQNKLSPPALIGAETTVVCSASNLLRVNVNIGHGSFYYLFVNLNYVRIQSSPIIEFCLSYSIMFTVDQLLVKIA